MVANSRADSFDIEDNGADLPLDESNRRLKRNNVMKRHGNSSNSVTAVSCGKDKKNTQTGNAPGVGSVYVKTWGCAHNNSDSEYMAGLLNEYGFQIKNDRFDADVWLLNSCTVKSPAEMHFRNFIDEGLKKNKSVIVSGCVAQSDPNSKYLENISIVGVQQIDRVIEVVEQALQGHTVRLLGTKKEKGKKVGGARLDLPKIRKNPFIEILAVNTGCLNKCTYCKTKHARGDLGSYSPADLVERTIMSFQDHGCKELWLTSEDTGAYGLDIATNLPELLWKLIEVTPHDCMIRVGMTNPPYMRQHLEEIGKILNHPRVYSFLHVPVQSGSDAVLADMKREYCREDFCEIVDYVKSVVPGVTIATDFICGFPSETDEDFEESLSLMQKYKFPTVFINQFFPRPGTPASYMRQIPGHLIKKRTAEMSKLFKSYNPYDCRIGNVYDILVTDVSFDGKHYVGHNKCYEQILVPKREEIMGKWVRVKVIATSKFSMHGAIIESGNAISTEVKVSIHNFALKLCHNFALSVNKKQSFILTIGSLCSISIPLYFIIRKFSSHAKL